MKDVLPKALDARDAKIKLDAHPDSLALEQEYRQRLLGLLSIVQAELARLVRIGKDRMPPTPEKPAGYNSPSLHS